MPQITSIDNSANIVSSQKEKTKDHTKRNITIAAGTGGIAGAVSSYLSSKTAEMTAKDSKDLVLLTNKEWRASGRFKAAKIITSALTFSMLYLAGSAIKHREDEDHLGRNTLIATVLGAVAGCAGLYQKVLGPIHAKIYNTPESMLQASDSAIKTAEKNFKGIVKFSTGIGGALKFAFYYLAAKGLYNKIKGQKAEKNS